MISYHIRTFFFFLSLFSSPYICIPFYRRTFIHSYRQNCHFSDIANFCKSFFFLELICPIKLNFWPNLGSRFALLLSSHRSHFGSRYTIRTCYKRPLFALISSPTRAKIPQNSPFFATHPPLFAKFVLFLPSLWKIANFSRKSALFHKFAQFLPLLRTSPSPKNPKFPKSSHTLWTRRSHPGQTRLHKIPTF